MTTQIDATEAGQVIVRLHHTVTAGTDIYRVIAEYPGTGIEIPELEYVAGDRAAAERAYARRVTRFGVDGVRVVDALDTIAAHLALPQLANIRADRAGRAAYTARHRRTAA